MSQNVQIASSITAVSKQYETITNNLANASTAGYKRQYTMFSRAMDALANPSSPQLGSNETPISAKSRVDFSQGNLVQTDQPLDMAITGEGFFVIETPEGPLYTRNGSFRVNNQGRLVDYLGRGVAGEGGPITVPKGVSLEQINVASDGSLSGGGRRFGKIQIVDFADKTALRPVGSSCFTNGSEKPAAAAEKFTLQQGYQESSNVAITDELVGLVTVSRLYEASLKTVNAEDDRLKSLLQAAMA